jgi:hypothetical protein
MIRHLLLALALAAGASSAAQAQLAATATADPSKVSTFREGQRGVPLFTDLNGRLWVTGVSGGSGGGGGAVTQGTIPWVISGNGTANGSNNPIFVQITNFPATQAVSAAALPLPAGAATAANQNSTAPGVSATNAQGVQGVTGGVPLPIQGGNSAAVKTDSSGVTQPVSGTITANQGTSPWTIAGTVTQGAAGASAWKVDGSGVTQPVSASVLPLPTGAATAANQASQNTLLTTANQNAQFQQDFNSTAVAANALAQGATLDAGASPSHFNWISFNGSATVTGGIFYIQASTDGFATSFVTVATAAVTTASPNNANQTAVPVSMADRVRYRYFRVVYQNGATAGAVTGASALTVN